MAEITGSGGLGPSTQPYPPSSSPDDPVIGAQSGDGQPTATLNPGSWVSRLLDAPMRPGTVTWIGLRPRRHHPLLPVARAELDVADGVVGDHYRSRTNQARHVTLIQSENIAAIAVYLGLDRIDPAMLRRNIVVSGINLHALKGRRFRLGTAICIATGECHPCSRMEQNLGPGGYNAVRGHGGITARVIGNGQVSLGDSVARLDGPG
jgi:MOSC domain-containing protein YiiM